MSQTAQTTAVPATPSPSPSLNGGDAALGSAVVSTSAPTAGNTNGGFLRGTRRRSKFKPAEDLIILREVAAARAHISPNRERKERFEIAASKCNATKKLSKTVRWKSVQDCYKRLQARFEKAEKIEPDMSGLDGEVGELEELLSSRRRRSAWGGYQGEGVETAELESGGRSRERRYYCWRWCSSVLRPPRGIKSSVPLQTATLDRGDEVRDKVKSDRLGLERERLEFEKQELISDREERAKDREDRREEVRGANDLDLQKFRVMMGVFSQQMGGAGGRTSSGREDLDGTQPSKERRYARSIWVGGRTGRTDLGECLMVWLPRGEKLLK